MTATPTPLRELDKPQPQYFTRPGGYDSDAAYIRFDGDGMSEPGIVVTVFGNEREPRGPVRLFDMVSLIQSGEAVKITPEQADALITHRSGRA